MLSFFTFHVVTCYVADYMLHPSFLINLWIKDDTASNHQEEAEYEIQ